MKKLFGLKKKDKEPSMSLNEVSTRLKKRAESEDEKIKQLDHELSTYKERITTTRPGPAQQVVKDQAWEIVKEKRMLEKQRDILYKQAAKLHQLACTSESIKESIKDAQQTKSALKSTNKELKEMMKTVNIREIKHLQDEMSDMMEVCKEMQVEALVRNDSLRPNDISEDLMGGRNVINES